MRFPSQRTPFQLCELGCYECWSAKWLPYTENEERMREEDHSRWVDGRFNKQGNLPQGEWISAQAHQNLKFYVELSLGFSWVYCPHAFNSTLLSQGCIFEDSSCCGKGGQSACSKDRNGGGEVLIASPSSGVLMTSLNNEMKVVCKTEAMPPGQPAKDFG